MKVIMPYMYLLIVILLIATFLFSVITDPDLRRIKPFTLSVIALGLIVFNLILYLTGYYNLLPDILFVSILFLVSVLGLIATFKVYKSNLLMSYITGGLSAITIFLGVFIFIMNKV